MENIVQKITQPKWRKTEKEVTKICDETDKKVSLPSGNRVNQVLLENKSALVTTVDSKLLRKVRMTLLNLQNRGQTDLEASVRYDWFSFDKVLKGSIVRNS